MHVSVGLWWGLAASVAVAIVVMATIILMSWRRIQRVKKEYAKNMTKNEIDNATIAFERTTQGQILHELKPKEKPWTSDVEMEFAYNTFVRNGYKAVSFFNFESDYEAKSFLKLVENSTLNNENYDFALVNTNGKVYDQIKKIYKNLNEKGLIMIVNAPKKSKEIKTLRSDLKLLGYRHEWQEISNGIILVAK